MQTMLAATYLAPGRIETTEAAIPKPRPDEALLRVHAVGVCGSDLAIVSGKHPRARPPLIIGHEFAGEVVEKPGSVSAIAVGDKATVYPLFSCGKCHACRHACDHVCSTLRLTGFDRDGGMAEYVAVPAGSLFRLPSTMSYDVGSLIEPLAVAVHALSMTRVTPDDTVAVLGAGPIGLLTAFALRARGVHKLVISDIDEARLAIARATGLTAFDARAPGFQAYVSELTSGDGVDVVFEAAGAAASARQMLDILRPRGTAVNVSVFKEPPAVDLRALNFKELTIVGSRVYTEADYHAAIELAESLPLERIVSHRLPLRDVSHGFELLFRGTGTCKVTFYNERAS